MGEGEGEGDVITRGDEEGCHVTCRGAVVRYKKNRCRGTKTPHNRSQVRLG